MRIARRPALTDEPHLRQLARELHRRLGLTQKKFAAKAEKIDEDGVPFEEKMAELTAGLYEQMAKADELDATIRQNLEALRHGE